MMATPVQKNLVSKNQAYAAGFKNANIGLLPANKYSVGTVAPLPLGNALFRYN